MPDPEAWVARMTEAIATDYVLRTGGEQEVETVTVSQAVFDEYRRLGGGTAR